MRKLSKLKNAIVLIIFFVLIVGCAPHPAKTPVSQQAKQACQTNALLQKYHCSLSQVTTAAQANDADAQYALAYMYYYGLDTPIDETHATLWMRRAAAQGQPQAMQALELLGAEAVKIVPKKIPAKTHSIAKREPSSTPMKITPIKQAEFVLGGYSIQLAASVSLARLKEYVISHHLSGQAGYYQSCIKGASWYILIYGHYANKSLATAALKKLSADLKAQHPWIKSYKLIEQQVKLAKNCL